MKQYVTDYLNYAGALMSEYNDSAKLLKEDNREDEAILYKVRANICDIFIKMAMAADKKTVSLKLGDEAEFTKHFNEEYLDWFEKIPSNWKINLELARKHNDVIVVNTEEIKLETAALLRNRFQEAATGADLVKQSEGSL